MKIQKNFVFALAMVLLMWSNLAISQSNTITMTLQKLRSAGSFGCYYTWAIENNSSANFTEFFVNFIPHDKQGYALRKAYVFNIRLTPNGKARTEQITSGAACDEINGIRIEGFDSFAKVNNESIDVNSWNKAYKFIFNGQAVNVKSVN